MDPLAHRAAATPAHSQSHDASDVKPQAGHRASPLRSPRSLDDLFLYRLTRLLATAGAPVLRLCEGRHHITRREWRLVAALAQDGPMLSSVLAARIHLERARTSKALTDLERKKIIQRTPRPNDRRRVDVSLTDAGLALYEQLFPEVVRINQELLAVMSGEELAQFDGLLDRLLARAEEVIATSQSQWPKAERRLGGRRVIDTE